jgi:HEAT repeat protein
MRHLGFAALACVLTASLTAPAPAETDSFLGKPLSHWTTALGAKDARTRRSAAFALGRIGRQAIGSASELVRLIDADREPEADVRDMAATALGDLVKAAPGAAGDLWPQAGPALQRALGNDTSPRVRRSVAYALGTFGPVAAPAATALREALASKDADVRQNAAWAIGQLGNLADDDTVSALRDRLGDDSTLVRRDAATALGKLGSAAAAKGAPALMDLVQRETDEVVRKAGLDALAHLAGKEHRGFAEPLKKLLDDRDAETSRGAALVLARVGGPPAIPAVPVLRKALKDSDVQVQRLAAAALANLGEDAAPAVGDLADVLGSSPDVEVRRNAAVALGHMGDKAKAGVPALGAALASNVPTEVRQAAAEALAHIAYPTNAAALADAVKAIRDDSDPLVRQRCVWALFKVDDIKVNGAKDVLEKVLAETGDNGLLVRYDAARVLANKLGPDAPDRTVDVLIDMLTNRKLRVFKGTDAKVEGAGNEASRGKTSVEESIGGDARYMAVQALGWMGNKASSRKEVVAALREAARDKDPKMKETVRKALENLNIEP